MKNRSCVQRSWNKILKFNDKNIPRWKENELIFLSNALAGEVGELCNLVKKTYGGGTNKVEVTDKMLVIEAVDIFVYLVMFVERLGFNSKDFEAFISEKIDILEKRVKSTTVKEN